MESTRNTNAGRGRGRGRGGGRNAQDPQHQGGRRGGHGAHRGSYHQSPTPTPAPIRQSHPPLQLSPGYGPPQRMPPPQQPQQQQQMGGGAVGRVGAWTGRPWGPSSAPRSPAQPGFQSQLPPQLSLDNLQISDDKSPTSSAEGKESRLQPIKRPGGGRMQGLKTITLFANHFRISFNEVQSIFHYDVDIKFSSEDKIAAARKMRRSDMCLIRETLFLNDPRLQNIVTSYDGVKNIYSRVPLPQGQFTVNIPQGEDTRGGTYEVTIRKVNELILSKLGEYISGDLSSVPRDVLQGLDVVMKENLRRTRVSVGKMFYSSTSGENLSRALTAYPGINQSLKATTQGLALCIDYSVLPFVRESKSVIQFLMEHIPGFRIEEINHNRKMVNDALKGLLVTVTHRLTKQKYTIAGLTKENARDIKFDMIDPQDPTIQHRTSLLEYFKDKWGVEIKYKNIPCLELGKGNRSNKVPLEFCQLVEQKYPKDRLDRRDGVSLKNRSLAKPEKRRATINELVGADDGPCGGGIADHFGIHVSLEMTQLVGHVLAAPQLKVRGSTINVDAKKCHWNFTGNRQLMDARPIECWAFIEFADRYRKPGYQNLDDFVQGLISRGCRLGVTMNPPRSHLYANMGDFSSVEKIENLLRRAVEESGEQLQLIICAMSHRDPGYNFLKWVAETRMGVMTQCCLTSSANNSRGQDQYLGNFLLKTNAKLGGSNFEIAGKLIPHLPNKEHVMFIGADVNHPSPMDKSCPSIAAVVGTVNWPAANRYVARIVPQTHRQERIVKFGSMCMDLVNTYKQFNRVWPDRIVLFRDGVSDAQFEMAMDEELHDLRKVFSANNYNPRVTLIVAQKRHHTRLFPETERGGVQENVPPGTVVDDTIVHPVEFDFYLYSHYGSMGTSKSTHYYVLSDENGFTPYQLQKLIYDSCFTYVRCTKPVSLVPPVYYADLAAFRGRQFQEAIAEMAAYSSSGSSSAGGGASSSFNESLYTLHPDLKNTMFFV